MLRDGGELLALASGDYAKTSHIHALFHAVHGLLLLNRS